MKYRVAKDVGNSSTKGIIWSSRGETFLTTKSVIARLLTLPNFSEEDERVAVLTLQDNLIVNITSPSVTGGLFAVGNKAIKHQNSRNMNIRMGSKHDDDIPVILPLATIAANAVKDYYEHQKTLPLEISIDVIYSSAIPAREYTPEIARKLESKLVGQHIVTVYPTIKPVQVTVNILKAKIVQEGIPAIYAIVEGNQELFAEYLNKYQEPVQIRQYAKKKLLIVDIGDGTTEFIYVVNGKPDSDLSTGERFGVGHAADEAKKVFDSNSKFAINMNRQQFMDAVLDEYHAQHVDANLAMNLANSGEAQRIFDYITEMYAYRLAGNVDEIVVLGGGSATFKNELADKLYNFADEVNKRILWIPAEYAANLNAVGLNILNEKLFYKEEVSK